jgi:hypothetical protein
MKEFGYVRLQFSAPIKQMFTTFARYAGMSEDDIARALEGDLKEQPLPELNGLSFRKFGETIGNDWGRGIDETLWVDLATRKIDRLLEEGMNVVIDDLRYPNEFDLIQRRYGGAVFRVARPEENGGRRPQWQSEGRLENTAFDANLENSGSVEDLAQAVRLAVRGVAQPIESLTLQAPAFPDEESRREFLDGYSRPYKAR